MAGLLLGKHRNRFFPVAFRPKSCPEGRSAFVYRWVIETMGGSAVRPPHPTSFPGRGAPIQSFRHRAPERAEANPKTIPGPCRWVAAPDAIPCANVVALWDAFYIENKRFDLDTLRVPSRSPTPISKSKGFLGQSQDIWGARGPHFRPILGVPGVGAGLKNTYVLAL